MALYLLYGLFIIIIMKFQIRRIRNNAIKTACPVIRQKIALLQGGLF